METFDSSQLYFDIVIVGGGLIGTSLACALGNHGFSVALIEAASPSVQASSDFDARSVALSPASRKILSTLGLWYSLKQFVTPIEQVHVSDRGHFGATHLSAEEEGVDALGYMIEVQHIYPVLQQFLQNKTNIKVYAPARLETLKIDQETALLTISHYQQSIAIKSKLVIAADGGNSTVRRLLRLSASQKDYQQTAIVANIGLKRPHHNMAFERFTNQGPLAMLPMHGQRAAMVWAMPSDHANELISLDDPTFLSALQQRFGYRLGKFVRVGKRSMFPLKLVTSDQLSYKNVVFIGNAAQNLHAIAGQGLNLGLRDVACLAEIIIRHGISDEALRKYQDWRQQDRRDVTRFTDTLASFFSTKLFPYALVRNCGLLSIEFIPALKKSLSSRLMGLVGDLPDLACSIALDNKSLNK